MNKGQLQTLRNKIDAFDKKIIELLNERANIALEIGKLKRKTVEAPIFYRPEREAQVLRKAMQLNQGPLQDEDIANIFRAIMSAGRALQQPLTIAFLGPEGTFSHEAVLKHFGKSCQLLSAHDTENIFKQVEAKRAQYGLVPIENSTEGIVNSTLDTFTGANLKICGEIEYEIHQNLLSNSDKTNIHRIYSHSQSLAQCKHWLNKNFPDTEKVAVGSNAQAAKIAANEKNTAAIAGKLAAELYELNRIAENIEDNPDNITRFWIIGQQETSPSGKDKTSILINTTNVPGAFARIMQPFADNHVNITLFESRPHRKRSWNYIFFLDIEGHKEDKNVKKALIELAKHAHLIQILGSYPRAIMINARIPISAEK